MIKRILHCVDMQGGFMDPRCKELYVGGAQALIEKTNAFFDRIPQNHFDHAIFTYDTHFWFEYSSSPEAGIFPNIHCEFGTDGWRLSVFSTYPMNSGTPVWYVAKNEFDFWGKNKLTDKIKIVDQVVNDTTLRVFQDIMVEIGLNADNVKDVAELNPKTATQELKNYLGDTGSITVVPLNRYGHQSAYVYEQNGQRNALAFVYENVVAAYKNLFHYSQDVNTLKPGIHRDEFLKDIGSDTEVVIAGVASDYCVKQAMIGYLERGCQVVVMQDLVKGIGAQIDGVAQSDELKKYYESGQLRLQDSAEYLANAKKPAPSRHPAPRLN